MNITQILIGVAGTVILSVGIGLTVSLFAKFFPREKTYNEKIGPVVKKLAGMLSKFLRARLGPESERKIEEGILCTILYWIKRASEDYEATMKSDNVEMVIKRVYEASEVLKGADKVLDRN